MPHIVVKLHPGRTEQQKVILAQELAKVVTFVLGTSPEATSVGIEDVSPADWVEKVAKPDIQAKPKTIYKSRG